MDFVSSLWVEKFRPKKLEDLVLSELYREKFQEYIDKKEIPHLLFTGPAGSGKSSLARILTSKNGIMSHPSGNVIQINGSSKSERGIEYVDRVIEEFLKSSPDGNDKIKIVYIDECDNMTKDSFRSLRGIIEKYENTGRFLCTANYISKIPPEIQSRFQTFSFKQISINFVTDYCKNILTNEGVEYKNEDLNILIKEVYPDIRKIVNTMEKNTIKRKLILSKDSTLVNEKKIITFISQLISYVKNKNMNMVSKSVTNIVEILNDTDLDYRNIYSSLFFNNDIPVPVKIIVNDYTNSHDECLIPSMHFCAMLFKIITCVNGGK